MAFNCVSVVASPHSHRLLHTPEVDAPNQNLIRSLLFLRQPLKGFVREQAGDERINNLL